METIKVSVIIPVYNVAPWLGECLESVISQDYENLQIICVNDGSTDESPQILESYAVNDSRISIFDQKNLGPGAARNRGMDLAVGKYFTFLDSDDMFAPGIIKKMVDYCEHNKLDMLQCSGETIWDTPALREKHRGFQYKCEYPEIYNGLALFCKLRKNGEFTASSCRKIYRSDFLNENNIRFVNIQHEDELWTFQCCFFADRCGVIPDKGYIRRYREGSTMTKPKTIDNIRSYYQISMYMKGICLENRDKVREYTAFIGYSFMVMRSAAMNYKKNRERILEQARDDFDVMMLKELDSFFLPQELR